MADQHDLASLGKLTEDEKNHIIIIVIKNIRKPYNCLKHCILNGANVNASYDNGWTGLHESIKRNKIKLVRLLLEFNADPNLKSNDQFYYTPFEFACSLGNENIIELMVRYGGNIKEKTGDIYRAIYVANSNKTKLFIKNILIEMGEMIGNQYQKKQNIIKTYTQQKSPNEIICKGDFPIFIEFEEKPPIVFRIIHGISKSYLNVVILEELLGKNIDEIMKEHELTQYDTIMMEWESFVKLCQNTSLNYNLLPKIQKNIGIENHQFIHLLDLKRVFLYGLLNKIVNI